MSTGNQSCLRFSLEESVWFQRGQEVAELISISLDPDITIQENDQYVTIKGSLALSGEYKCPEQTGEGEAGPPLNGRVVHSVTEREEGALEFLHQFPVDITIPQNRIQSIDDIDIAVETFDYDFPEQNSMKLTAELAITGLYGEQQHGSEEEEEAPSSSAVEVEDLEPLYRQTATAEAEIQQEQEVETSFGKAEQIEPDVPEYQQYSFVPQPEAQTENANQEASSLYEPFRAEAKKEPQLATEEKAESAQNVNNQAQEPASLWSQGLEQSASTQEEESNSNVTPFPVAEAESTPSAVEENEPELVERAEETVEPEVQQVPIINQKAQVEAVVEEVEESSSSSSSSEEKPKSKKASKKKGLSIAEFLARKEESEVAKLRVCIVQQGDSIQEIADRYEVSVQQILSLNHLGLDQDVAEGQVLYVPAEYIKH
ncbi:stage VI sporulation protein D [Mesobacillus persicus]|uniref:Stage VI sporulation protein D n=1 Tax=Mesobacillus persicus TaxID=930146 RepID=A0A1H7XII4_9BACI|nr:stage VI sporulation protein D [Mesobacillus persicus]SEM33596.1 stage VI sporulation protein D [Mesobacillus persicus]